MAILTRKNLTEDMVPVLDAVFRGEHPGWAVYADYIYDNQEWRIAKVEQ